MREEWARSRHRAASGWTAQAQAGGARPGSSSQCVRGGATSRQGTGPATTGKSRTGSAAGVKRPHHCPAARESKARLRWWCAPTGPGGAASLGTGPSFSQRGVVVLVCDVSPPDSLPLAASDDFAVGRKCKWSCADSLRTNQPSAAISTASTAAVSRCRTAITDVMELRATAQTL